MKTNYAVCQCCSKPSVTHEMSPCCDCGTSMGACCLRLAGIYDPILCPTCRSRRVSERLARSRKTVTA